MESTDYFEIMSSVSEKAQNYLSVLNDAQFEAAVHTGSPLLILAGAGSGKTRVITTKIAYLIGEKHIAPWQILAVTFTKKAATEMRERAIQLEERAAESKILTFHSFGARFLRKNCQAAGVSDNFTVYDDDDSLQILTKSNPKLQKNRAKHYAHLISLAKDYCLLPDDDLSDLSDSDDEFPKIYANYQNRLRETGNVDFGDLILLPYLTLKNDAELCEYYRNRFRAVLVDEYQDSNVAQFKLLQELTGAGEDSGVYVCVVGDDDQSIYKFRGAEIQNILTFEKEFPNTKIIRLEKNYRSTAEILQVADDVVKHNLGRLGKTLSAERGSGKKPTVAFLDNESQEPRYAVDLIKKSVEAGAKFSDWAILYRTNAQSLNFENAFMQNRIPYQVVGSLKFYEREEVKDVLAFLAFLANEKDEFAFRRIINKPARGIGAQTQEKIAELSRKSLLDKENRRIGFLEACEQIAPSLPKKARTGAESFVNLIRSLRKMLEEKNPHFIGIESNEKKIEKIKENAENSFDFNGIENSENQNDKIENEEIEDSENPRGFQWKTTNRLADVLWAIAEKSGLCEHYKAEDEFSGTTKAENLVELANSAVPFELSLDGLISFLDHIELDRAQNDEDSSEERVTLITLHNTKGLEFKRVIIAGMENSIFPMQSKTGDELEEERRLCYVGITRARDELYFTCCEARRIFGRTEYSLPSKFLNEIEREHLEAVCAESQLRRMNNFLQSRHGKNGLSNPQDEKDFEIMEKYSIGTAILNDDYGFGKIIRAGQNQSLEYRIWVRFESGELKSFLPKYNAHKLKIIDESDFF